MDVTQRVQLLHSLAGHEQDAIQLSDLALSSEVVTQRHLILGHEQTNVIPSDSIRCHWSDMLKLLLCCLFHDSKLSEKVRLRAMVFQEGLEGVPLDCTFINQFDLDVLSEVIIEEALTSTFHHHVPQERYRILKGTHGLPGLRVNIEFAFLLLFDSCLVKIGLRLLRLHSRLLLSDDLIRVDLLIKQLFLVVSFDNVHLQIL